MPHKPIAIVAMLTIYHNLQYHRLVCFTPQVHARRSLNAGVTARPSSSPQALHYLIIGVAFGVLYQVPRQYVNHDATPSVPHTARLGFLWGYALLHTTSTQNLARAPRHLQSRRAVEMENSHKGETGGMRLEG